MTDGPGLLCRRTAMGTFLYSLYTHTSQSWQIGRLVASAPSVGIVGFRSVIEINLGRFARKSRCEDAIAQFVASCIGCASNTKTFPSVALGSFVARICEHQCLETIATTKTPIPTLCGGEC